MACLKKQLVGIVLAMTMMIAIISAAPKPGAEFDPNNNPCIYDEQKVEVCQRCAKQTRSNVVYPMCCNSEDNVYEWCQRFINYGRNNNPK